MRVTRWMFVALLALPLGAQSPEPEPVPAVEERSESQELQPKRLPPAFKTERVPFRRAETAARAAEAPLPALLRLRALETKAGEAVVELDRQRLTLKPGDRVGTDVVRVADEGLLVLDRPAVAGHSEGAATVVVRFDPMGRPRVRIMYEQAPAVAPAGASR